MSSENKQKINRKLTIKKITEEDPLLQFGKMAIPSHFKDILITFIFLDIEVNKLIKKRETPYIDRLSRIFNEKKRIFNNELFGQILNILPESYSYEYNKTPAKVTRHYQERIRIIPNLSFGLNEESTPKKSEQSLSLKQLANRKKQFYERLLSFVQESHNEFVRKNSETCDENKESSEWCKDFELENLVPKIEAKPLLKYEKITENQSHKSSPVAPLPNRKSQNDFVKETGVRRSSEIGRKTPESRISTVKSPKTIENCRVSNHGNSSKSPLPTLDSKKSILKSPKTPEINNNSPANRSLHNRLDDSTRTTPRILNQTRLSFAISGQKTVSPSQNKIIDSNKSPVNNQTEFRRKQKLSTELKRLLLLFNRLDKAIRDSFIAGHTFYLSKIAGNDWLHKNFSEKSLGKIMALYPGAYVVKWEPMIHRQAVTPGKKFDIAVKPNLRGDGTRSSESTGQMKLIKYDYERLLERCELFMDKCWDFVVASYKGFLIDKLSVPEDRVAELVAESRWKSEFNVELHVKPVVPVPMPSKPERPSGGADGTESIAKIFAAVKQRNADSSMAAQKTSPVNDKCKSISRSLLDKVRLNRISQATLTHADPKQSQRRLLEARVPDLVKVIHESFEHQSTRTLELKKFAPSACLSLTITPEYFNKILETLLKLVPGWVKLLPWQQPCLRMENPDLTIADINNQIQSAIAALRSK